MLISIWRLTSRVLSWEKMYFPLQVPEEALEIPMNTDLDRMENRGRLDLLGGVIRWVNNLDSV